MTSKAPCANAGCMKTRISGFIALLFVFGGPISAQTSQTFNTSGIFTVPAGVTSLTVHVWGGGGAGGGNNQSNGTGGGGGGGAYKTQSGVSVIGGATYAITVGAGGIPGTNSGKGGNSQAILGSTVTANGGNGGSFALNGIGGTGGTGGTYEGGSGSNGLNGNYGGGGAGGAGTGSDGNSAINTPNGAIAVTGGGPGGDGRTGSNGNGASPVTGPGGGGGGCRAGGTARTGGTGYDGQVILSWTIPPGYCAGNAISVFNQINVTNSPFAVGPANSIGAELYETGDQLDLELTTGDLLTSGGTVNVAWRRISGSNTIIRVEISPDGFAWTFANNYTNINPQNTWITQAIPLTINTRYIRFISTNGYDLQIDAINYHTPCTPPCVAPALFNVTGGGSYCTGGGGLPIGLSGSETGVTYQLYRGAFAQGLPVSGSGAALNFGNQTAAGTYSITATRTAGGCMSTMTGNAVISVITIPSQPGTIAGTSSPCINSSQSYNITAVPNATTYTWAVPTGWTITAGQGTTAITVTCGTAGQNGSISVTAGNSCGASSANSLTVTLSPSTPATPGTITGASAQCPGLTGQAYSILTVPDASTYTWTVPSGWAITAGQGTVSLTVSTGASGQNGNISVTSGNSCGTSNASTLAVTVGPGPPAIPGVISGTTTQCPSLAGQTYSISPVTNAINYIWAVPAGWAITSGQGTVAITATTGFEGQNGNISVTAGNPCGTSLPRTLAVSVSPAPPVTPGAIIGNITQCPSISGQNYNISAVPNSTLYTWIIPTGWTVTSGAGTTSITATTGLTGQNGNITVTASNSCGTSAVSTLAVTVGPAVPATPGLITGTTTQCPVLSGQTYSIAPVTNATSYAWTVPSGWSITAGQGTQSITATTGTAGQNGNIAVIAENNCGTSTASLLAVTVGTLPAQTGPITPSTPNVCQNSTQNYMVNPPQPPGVTYTWSGPSGSTILSGQGTYLIQIKYGITSGNLSITPNNSCGNGPPQNMAITVINAVPTQPSTISGLATPCSGATQPYSVIAVPGIIYAWTVPLGWVITVGQGTNSITVTAGATTGTIQVIAGNACGGSAPRILSVSPSASLPLQPSAIIGNLKVCRGNTTNYSVISVPNVAYTWSVPTGWIINSGQGTNSINATSGLASENITVVPSNLCGNGTERTLAVTVDAAIPSDPGPITGSNNPCEASSQVYSVSNQAGVTYAWSVPSGSNITAGQGTNSITVTLGSNPGTITTVPSNACGTGPNSSTPITISPLPASGGAISGSILQCEGTIETYSIIEVSGNTYNWSVPTGWTINSGQGLNSISVVTGVNSGNIQVTPTNECGTGPTSTLAVIVNPSPPALTGNNTEICTGATVQIGGPAVPGNTYSWISVPAGFTSNISNPVVAPSTTTTYYLEETNPVSGCTKSDSITIIANQIIVVSIIPVTQAQTICNGGNTNILLSSNINGTFFSWAAVLTAGSGTTFINSGTGNVINQVISNTSALPSTVTYTITATADVCVNSTTSVAVTINPSPLVNMQSTTVCSEVPTGIILGASTNGVAVVSYNITAIQSNGLSASAGSPSTGNGMASNTIADDAWTNNTLNQVNVVYTIVPVSALGCAGNPFTVTVTVKAKPSVTCPVLYGICSGSATSINLTATIPSTFTWTIGTITGSITGASAGSGSNISQTLTNPGNSSDGTVTYLVTPVSAPGSCTGAIMPLVVTVHPKPAVTNAATSVSCSAIALNIQLTASVSSSFSWTIGTITGGITGALAGNGTTISQTLINPDDVRPGTVQYIITPISQVNLCNGIPFILTVTVNPKPAVTASSSTASACAGTTFNLFSSSSISPEVLLSEAFNPATYTWTKTNTSSSGTPANANWTVRGDGYVSNAQTFHSNDASQFYISDSYSQNGTITATTLVSPLLSTVGYSSLALSFWHYYDFNSRTSESAKVEVSTNNGTSWNTVATYTNDRGGVAAFQNEIINLGVTYINSSNFLIRFNYYCGSNRGRYWAIDNVTLTGTPSVIPAISWTSSPAGFASSVSNPTNVSQVESTLYTATYTNPSSGCSNSASIAVTSLPVPAVTITPDYCAIPGRIQLTATGGGTYLWSNGMTTQVIIVDIAGLYAVTVTAANGCTTSVSMNISNELVSNGSFSAGNTGFTSGYVYDPAANGLYAPESEYAINNNAQYNHTNFWGYDHTSGTGTGNAHFMIVNGAKYAPQPTVWQETATVSPNTDYYFSAWAMSLNNVSPFARLRFEVNGVQLGTIASLTTGINIVNNPWLIKDRFYGSWNSGAATSATIRIIDLETAAGGNDFGLDDISFGTLSPVPFTFNPTGNNGTNMVCEGLDLQLNANIFYGLPPYHTSWTGPNGFTSSLQDPLIPNMTLSGQGLYYLTVYDSYGCTPQTKSVFITVIPAPTAIINGGGNYCQYGASPLIAFTGNGGTAPYTFTYNINGGLSQTLTTFGTSNTAIVFAPTASLGSYTYSLTNVVDSTGCERDLNSATTVVVRPLPAIFISGDSPICAGSSGNIYTSIAAMNTYAWSISGNGTIPGASNGMNVDITTGNTCGNPFTLYLDVTDEYGCSSFTEESFMVDDNIAPEILTCPPDKTISGTDVTAISPLLYSETPITITHTEYGSEGGNATDNCGIEYYSYSDTQSGTSPILVERTFTLTDRCGNNTTCTQVITIIVPPSITCFDPQSVNADAGFCTAVVNPQEPIVNAGAPITWTWVMSGATTGSGTGAIGNYTFNVGVTTITWTATNISGTDVCVQTITVVDNQAPAFIVPADRSYCVEDIYGATYWDPTVDITPNRPEYYLFVAGNTDLDLDTTTFTDNCAPGCLFEIRWHISFEDGTFLPVLPATYITGQPSLYGMNIQFPGSVTSNVFHHVTYQVADCHGNVSPPQTILVTVKPRPNVIKLN